MRFINALLQAEREFSEALSALSIEAAARSPVLRQKTRRVNRLMAEIEVIRKSLEKSRLQLLA